MKNDKYYSLKKILSYRAKYNVIYGERSNGKTYAVLKYGLEQYAKNKKQMAILRRWQEDFTGKRGSVMFDALVQNSEIITATDGEWTNVYYYASRWYLCRYENDKRITDETPFAYGFALSSVEHDKSTAYPNITTVLFDEFITRINYLNDEFVIFCNCLSTIIRQRDDVTVFMCGNTVNKYNPYFAEMGLTHSKEQKQGTIDTYSYGTSGLTVAVEYCGSKAKTKDSNVYFAFDNPKLNMIKSGDWELDIYPHCPIHYERTDVIYRYFIKWQDEILQGDIVSIDDSIFTFIHIKTSPIKDEKNDIIFDFEYNRQPNYRRRITNCFDNISRFIYSFFIKEKVFYQSNEIGEMIRNYINECKGVI